ncbi:DUF2637 domain-containing protein [Microbispora amethystogenes]
MLMPLAVDGLIVVASMSILLPNRYGSRGGLLAWSLLVAGSLASLIGRIIATWPSLALIGSYELLMSQIRQRTRRRPHDLPALGPDPVTGADAGPTEQQGDGEEDAEPPAEQNGNGRALQREAWRWAQQNRYADGDLPSGVAIARAFARSPRWGRLVKNAGLAGELT